MSWFETLGLWSQGDLARDTWLVAQEPLQWDMELKGGHRNLATTNLGVTSLNHGRFGCNWSTQGQHNLVCERAALDRLAEGSTIMMATQGQPIGWQLKGDLAARGQPAV